MIRPEIRSGTLSSFRYQYSAPESADDLLIGFSPLARSGPGAETFRLIVDVPADLMVKPTSVTITFVNESLYTSRLITLGESTPPSSPRQDLSGDALTVIAAAVALVIRRGRR
jgi:hypothetical protein